MGTPAKGIVIPNRLSNMLTTIINCLELKHSEFGTVSKSSVKELSKLAAVVKNLMTLKLDRTSQLYGRDFLSERMKLMSGAFAARQLASNYLQLAEKIDELLLEGAEDAVSQMSKSCLSKHLP